VRLVRALIQYKQQQKQRGVYIYAFERQTRKEERLPPQRKGYLWLSLRQERIFIGQNTKGANVGASYVHSSMVMNKTPAERQIRSKRFDKFLERW